jgi:lysozyme family protein
MNLDDFITTMKSWEGGLSRDLDDSASEIFCPTLNKDGHKYHTNKGITYAVWKSHFGSGADARFYEMNDKDWFEIFDQLFFKGIKGHNFKVLNIAAIVSDFAWGSGVSRAGKLLQKACNKMGANLVIDGQIGQHTLDFANSVDAKILFDNLIQVRKEFFISIGIGKNKKYVKGWIDRLNDNAKKFRP